MNQYIFFTLNDFSLDDGGTVRMRGIVNALAESGQSVTLISNTSMHYKFHQSIKHIFLDYKVSKQKRQLFLLLLSTLPSFFYSYIFRNIFVKVNNIMQENEINRTTIIFFEYIDNSIGYLLKKHNLIDNYINDMHGIAPLEFKLKKSVTSLERFKNFVKFKLAQKLEQKVIMNANKLIFLSASMKDYYEKLYPSIKKNINKILRDGVSLELCTQQIDRNKIQILHTKYNIEQNSNVIFFLGEFKDLGGVIDLIEAFKIIVERNKVNNLKLLLVGNGERFVDAQFVVKKYSLIDKVIFAGRIDYAQVRNYQELASVIVCPDKQHQFSEYIPHIKYFDSLVSGKVVINGSFASIQEINKDQKYSINFEPSNIEDLADKIEYVFKNIDNLQSKYKNNAKNIYKDFSYINTVQILLD